MTNRGRTSLATAAALIALCGCDQTVFIEPQKNSFTDVVVPGACKQTDLLDLVDVSVQMFSGEQFLTPDFQLSGERTILADVVTEDSFEFRRLLGAEIDCSQNGAPDGCSEVEQSTLPGYATAEADDRVSPLTLLAEDVNFEWTGGEENRCQDRLTVLVLDSSGSLLGIDADGNPQLSLASDREDQRISFYKSLVTINNDDPDRSPIPQTQSCGSGTVRNFVSLVWFNENGVIIDEDFSTPTRNRQVVIDELDQLARNEQGGTRLADALDRTKRFIIDVNRDLNPRVILFTDGWEDGDKSDAELNEVIDAYAGQNGEAPIPTVVLQLQPKLGTGYDQGRAPELVDLACRSGGEHIFLETAEEFTSSRPFDLLKVVSSRLTGVWRVQTRSGLERQAFAGNNSYFVTTELAVVLGGISRSVPLVRSVQQDNDGRTIGSIDTRLWFFKQ
jgi:hypothetical protein